MASPDAWWVAWWLDGILTDFYGWQWAGGSNGSAGRLLVGPLMHDS